MGEGKLKLKEKLANKTAIEIGPESLVDCKRLELAYLVGFENALEMAVDLAMKWNRKDFAKLKGSTFTHDHFPIQRILFTSELKQLGEGEVE